jgi:acyl-CoA reductase-like NAD-dependent aldehyde dehydrogenase
VFNLDLVLGVCCRVHAAERLTPVTLDLGGKDAFVLCEDADLNQVRCFVVPGLIRGCFSYVALAASMVVAFGCVEGFIPVTLELGGKDAFVVCEDADLNQVCRVC